MTLDEHADDYLRTRGRRLLYLFAAVGPIVGVAVYLALRSLVPNLPATVTAISVGGVVLAAGWWRALRISADLIRRSPREVRSAIWAIPLLVLLVTALLDVFAITQL